MIAFLLFSFGLTLANASIGCETCPAGFNDSCNSCGCDEDGEEFCSFIACGPDDPVGRSCFLNCENCPNGYFDGCNECYCNADGDPVCTLKTCLVKEEPRCESPFINCENCPLGYFDGCNQCDCQEDGSSICTLRFCPTVSILDAKCVTTCEECPWGYFDGCNQCLCEDGVALCTAKFCSPDTLQPATCDPPPVNLEICPFGYFDGCNTCSVDGEGVEICTDRACTAAEYEEPKCLIDCELCPEGFFDGCNECICQDGESFCSADNTCPTLSLAVCTLEDTNDLGQPICDVWIWKIFCWLRQLWNSINIFD